MRRLVPTGAAVLALVGAGCGSSGPSSGPAPSSTLPPIVAAAAAAITTTSAPAPTTTLAVYYEVQKGDSLRSIAAKFKVRMQDLITANQIKNADKIRAGQKLLIPPPTVLVNAPPTTVAESSSSATQSG